MKAVILAAGNGERLKPLTDTVPKCLVLVRGVPILGIWLELCRQNHINDVLINTHAHSEVVNRYLSDQGVNLRLTITYEEQLLGSAGTLQANRRWIMPDEAFWIFYGDVLSNVSLQPMLEFHKQHPSVATIGVYEVSNPSQCGIVCIDDDNTVQEFVEKPAESRGNLAFSGVMIGTPALLDAIPAQVPADLGFHVLPKLLGRMLAYKISEYLVDIGTPSAYQQAQLSWPGLGPAA